MPKLFRILALSFLLISSDAFAASYYLLNPDNAEITWQAKQFGYINIDGKFTNVQGEIIFNQHHPEKSKVNVVIDIASISTGLPMANKYLKGRDLFNIKQFPQATFVTRKIIIKEKNYALIYGKLTLLGTSKPIVLNVDLIQTLTAEKTIILRAATSIKRSEFGMNHGILGISDEIIIHINIKANNEDFENWLSLTNLK